MPGRFFNLRVKDPKECKRGSFRTQDVGERGGHMRIACQPKKGQPKKGKRKWMTQAWRLPKDEWKKRGKTLTPVTKGAKDMKKKLTKGGKMSITQKTEYDYQLK